MTPEQMASSLAFLRSIPAAERQRSQTEFLHAVEAVDALIEHFGPGKDPEAVPIDVCNQLLARIFQATATHPTGCSPLFERTKDGSFEAYSAFFARMKHLFDSRQIDTDTENPMLLAVGLLEPSLLHLRQFHMNTNAKHIMLEAWTKSVKARLLLVTLDEEKQVEGEAALRDAWPGTSLTLKDLMACSHLGAGLSMIHLGKIEGAVPEIGKAVELGGVRLCKVFNGPALLFEAGKHAAACSRRLGAL